VAGKSFGVEIVNDLRIYALNTCGMEKVWLVKETGIDTAEMLTTCVRFWDKKGSEKKVFQRKREGMFRGGHEESSSIAGSLRQIAPQNVEMRSELS